MRRPIRQIVRNGNLIPRACEAQGRPEPRPIIKRQKHVGGAVAQVRSKRQTMQPPANRQRPDRMRRLRRIVPTLRNGRLLHQLHSLHDRPRGQLNNLPDLRRSSRLHDPHPVRARVHSAE